MTLNILYILLVPLSLAWITITLNLINYGLYLCDENNVFGILILSIALNIIGTFIGCMIMYKNQNPNFKFWLGFKNKFKSIFKFRRKKKVKNNTI